MTNVGVVRFPGSNCEFDVKEAVERLGGTTTYLWHGDPEPFSVDAVIIPGGFAHGDYLRPGAIAQFSPVMKNIVAFAERGGPVLGICNGFQVLTETSLLPGALHKNAGLKFKCENATIEVVTSRTPFTSTVTPGSHLELPINHFEGNFACTPDTLNELQDSDRIVFRYVDNPNGSLDDIAGISNEKGNVVGLMPHPERSSHPLLGSTDGNALFESLLSAVGVS